jgi:thiamine pyrophosphate-dependent acetolactate synthase large subunit-like protein
MAKDAKETNENVKEVVEQAGEIAQAAAEQPEYVQVPKDIFLALYNYFIMNNKDVLSLYEATKNSFGQK